MQHNGHRSVNGVYTCIQEMYREIGRTDISCARPTVGWKKEEVLNAEEQKEKLCPNLPGTLRKPLGSNFKKLL